MPQAVDEEGNIWETDAQGNPVRFLGRRGASSNVVPSDPARVSRQRREDQRSDNADQRGANADARSERGDARDDIRTGIAVRDERRNDDKTRFDFARDLRTEFTKLPQVSEYQTVVRQYASALRTQPNASGDQALITAYAKMLDPGSVVREQEFATIAKSDSSIGQMVARLSKELGVDESGMLRPEIRARVREEMHNLTAGYRTSYEQARQDYTRNAESYGVDPVRVVGEDLGLPYQEAIEAGRAANQNAMKQDNTGTGPSRLAGGGDERQSIPIPQDMQAEYEAYVGANRGQLDPEAYAQFRNELDQKYGFPVNDAAKLDEHREWARQANDAVSQGRNLNLRIPAPDKELTGLQSLNASVFNNPVGAAVLAAPPLAGGMDELVGGAKALALGTDYDVERERIDGMRQALRDEYPWESFGGEVAGSAAGAGAALKYLPRAAGFAGTLPGILTAGAGMGAAEGALENNNDRLGGALTGASAGVAGGLAGRYAIAPALEAISRSQAAENAVNRTTEQLSRLTGRPASLWNAPRLDEGQQAISRLTPDLPMVRSNIADAADLGLPYALVDAAPQLRALGGTLSRKSVNVRDLAERTFEPRGMGQADRAVENIGKLLAPVTDVKARTKELREAGNIASSPFYRMAGERVNPIPPGMGPVTGKASPADREITAMLNTPTGKDALKRAHTIAADSGRNPEALGLVQDGSGNIVLRQGHSFETLDLVKKGLDSRIQEAADPLTGKVNLQGNPQLQAIEGLRKRFVERMDAVNPDYKKARDTYAPYGQSAEALEMGFQGTTSRLPPRDLERIVGEMKPHQLDEYRRGYATAAADKAEAARMQSDPYKAIYGSPAQQEKFRTLYPEGAPRFGRLAELEDHMAKTRTETLGGSQTAPRLQADQSFGATLGEDGLNAAGSMLTGGGANSLGSAGLALGRKALGGRFGGAANDLSERRAEEMAPRLFDTENPQSILGWLDDMTQTQAAIDRRRRAAMDMGGLLGGMALPGMVQ